MVTKIGSPVFGQSRRFFSDFFIFRNRQDPSKSGKFTMVNPIVNCMYFHGS